MVNYNEWSDHKVNKKLATSLGERVSNEHECLETGACFLMTKVYDVRTPFNPCNNFDDWYKLAEKYGMSLDVSGRASIPKSISKLDHVISHTCEGKLGRAVAICVLKLKDAENDR